MLWELPIDNELRPYLSGLIAQNVALRFRRSIVSIAGGFNVFLVETLFAPRRNAIAAAVAIARLGDHSSSAGIARSVGAIVVGSGLDGSAVVVRAYSSENNMNPMGSDMAFFSYAAGSYRR
ncbi:hypothetical protein Aduo_003844 [Ancylostoma duodenale]